MGAIPRSASRLYRPRPRARPRGHGELLKLLRVASEFGAGACGGAPPAPRGKLWLHLQLEQRQSRRDARASGNGHIYCCPGP